MASRRWPDPPAAPEGFARTLVTGAGGAEVAVYERSAATAAQGRARGVVCLIHDVAEHAGRYAEAATAIAAAGFHVRAHDLRGHGATRAPDAPLGVFAARRGLDRVIEDAVAVAERARAVHPGAPVVALGLGIGGLIGLNVALVRPDAFDGFAVWSADARADLARRIRRATAVDAILGAGRPSGRLQAQQAAAWSAPFQPVRTQADWRSSDAAEVDRYLADPLCAWAPSVSLWRDVADAVDRVNERAAWGAVPRGTPFHLLGGADDPSTDQGEAVVALDAQLRDIGFTDVARVILDDTRHDVLHDVARPEALRHLLRWLDGLTTA